MAPGRHDNDQREASFDTTASTSALTTFYPGVDGAWLFANLAVVALALILATRGRLGYQPEPIERPAPTLTGAPV